MALTRRLSVLVSTPRKRKIWFIALGITAFLYFYPTVLGQVFGRNKINARNELEFQKLLQGARVPAFLIEPRYLLSLLTVEDLLLFRKREIDVKNLSRSDSLTTYGIFEEYSLIINENTVKMFRSNSYHYSKSKALDARQFHWDKNRNRIAFITTHHFFVKHRHVFHLVVFYKRKNFLWSSEIALLPPIVRDVIKPEELLLGGNAAAFEKFQISTMQYRKTRDFILVPSDIRQFLFELPSSKFLECNYQIASNFYAKNWESSKPNQDFNQATLYAIEAMKKLMEPFLIPFWITSGTLLGWYRQCDVIPYTSDIDFSAWARDIDSSLDVHVRKNQEKLTLRIIIGIPQESYQYVFLFHNLRVDFFFTYKGENNYWYGGHGPGKDIFFHYNYPKFVLCSGELLGQKVLIPCNPEDVISAEYGKNWFIPVKQWHYAFSAFNIGKKFLWPKELVNKTHIYL